MMMPDFEIIVLFFVSVVANLLSAFAGGGAGLLQLPALIFLGLTFSTALATHKVASVALGVGATLRYLRERDHFQLKFMGFMLVTGSLGAVLGANVILSIPDQVAQWALGILTLGLGGYSLLQPTLGQVRQHQNLHPRGLILGGIGFFMVGVLNGSLTSGTGLFATLWLVYWFGFDYKQAVSYTLILVGLFWNGSGAVVLALLGQVQWDWLPALLLGSLLGGYLGAHLSIAKGNRWIKRGFEAMTVVVGLMLIFG